MGVITQISSQKSKKRVNVFVDNIFKSGLSVETAVKFGLKVGKDINDDELDEIILNSETGVAFDVALNFLSATPKSKYEVRQKLFKKGFSIAVIDKAMEKLEEYHYVDDVEYAKIYISSVSKKSKREIIEKLKKKGVEKQIIDNVIVDIADDMDEKNAGIYARKYLNNKEISQKNINNLISNLVRKGYSYELALSVVERIKQGEDLWLV